MRALLTALVMFFALCSSTSAQPIKVDVELVILIDSSTSISSHDFFQQRKLIQDALISDNVIKQLQSNFHQKIAIQIVEFSGATMESEPDMVVIVDWMVVRNKQEMQYVIESFPKDRLLDGLTKLGHAYRASTFALETNQYEGTVKRINIFCDGVATDEPVLKQHANDVINRNDPTLSVTGIALPVGISLVDRLNRFIDSYLIAGPKGRRVQFDVYQLEDLFVDNLKIEAM